MYLIVLTDSIEKGTNLACYLNLETRGTYPGSLEIYILWRADAGRKRKKRRWGEIIFMKKIDRKGNEQLIW